MPWGWITAVIGCIIVVFSLNQIIREVRKGGIPNLEDQSFSDTFYEALQRLDALREDMDSINETFYETVERLEARIEVLEKRTKPVPENYQQTDRYRIEIVSVPESIENASVIQSGEPTTSNESTISDEYRIKDEMRRMLESGMDSQIIARELNRGIGEVELIKRLIRPKNNS